MNPDQTAPIVLVIWTAKGIADESRQHLLL